jgi:hypothetical protein
MNIEDKAAWAKRLRGDEAFQMFMAEVREDAIAAFTESAAGETAKREEAHAILRALSKLDGKLQSALNDKAVKDKKKGQDRASD